MRCSATAWATLRPVMNIILGKAAQMFLKMFLMAEERMSWSFLSPREAAVRWYKYIRRRWAKQEQE